MGLSTFGQSKDRQAQSLRDQGYSERAIQSYQERTAATAARAAQQNMRTEYGNDDSRPTPVSAPVATAPSAPSAPATTTPTPTPPDAPSADAAPGEAEQKVEAEAKSRKGRASTIATAPTGLLTTARTRRRRSLMGGSEPGGLIS